MILLDTTPWAGGRVEVWTQASEWGEAMTLAATDRGLAYLGFGDCSAQLGRLFGSETVRVERTMDLDKIERLHVWGTPFQEAVWRALLEIPLGGTTSYGAIAEKIGRPRAVRAVGTAVGSNRVSILLPCHRVLRGDGSLGGYAWGLELKKKILKSENAL